MALIEIEMQENGSCIGCGRRVNVGDIAYHDDEMDGIWCKRCFDETVAELEAEEALEAEQAGFAEEEELAEPESFAAAAEEVSAAAEAAAYGGGEEAPEPAVNEAPPLRGDETVFIPSSVNMQEEDKLQAEVPVPEAPPAEVPAAAGRPPRAAGVPSSRTSAPHKVRPASYPGTPPQRGRQDKTDLQKNEAAVPEQSAQAYEKPGRSNYYIARSAGAGTDSMQDLWERYHAYMAESLRCDMVDSLDDISSSSWTCMASDIESVIAQGAPVLPLTSEIESLLSRKNEDQHLIYGWPMIVLDGAEGLQAAPFLMVNLEQPPYTGKGIRVIGQPIINPAVLRSIWSYSGDISFLRSILGNEVPRGAVAISKFIKSVCEVMGLNCYDLDPLKLVRELPADPGVYNSAVIMLAEAAPEARSAIGELTAISQNTSWEGCAAAGIFGKELKENEDHDTMPVMPWSAESVFEDALQLIRNKPVTVFNMSQRDVIDQLIVSACANAWIDNESILVLSDNEKKLDEMANLARDVHPALLVRTCVDDDLKRNPKRRCGSLSSLAKVLLDEVQSASSSIRQIIENAYKELEKVEENRRIALKGAAHRKRWSDKKIAWENKRLEVAKRIWLHGLYPKGTDPKVIGPRARTLTKVGFLKDMRSSMFLKKIGANKAGATVEDVADWSNISLHIKQAEAEIAKINDPDKYNIGAVNYRWAACSIGAVSARVSGALSGCSRTLNSVMATRSRDEQTKKLVTSLVPHIRAWASDYESAYDFFDLQSDLFDVVIFDNANHINLAWALPWMFRAKRIVVIGDSNGVPPSVFLDSNQLNALTAYFGFDLQNLLERGLEYGSCNVLDALSKI
ncbi:hypothetical protein IJT93_01120 [bacterium]|nr:hypothetical protein [bacterium]